MESQVDNPVRIKVNVISDVEGMKRIEHPYDAFICEHGGGPFLLSGFVNQFLRPNYSDFIPCILVFSVDNKIIGVAPLAIRDGLVHRECSLLMDPFFPSAFVFDPGYVKTLFRETLTILYRDLGCLFFDFTYSAISEHLPVLKQACGELGISFLSVPFEGNATIPVKGSWAQFEKSRRHLRREFERTERRMRELGQLKIEWFGKGDDGAEVLRNILMVVRTSWRAFNQPPENFRFEYSSILYALNGCEQLSLTVPAFNWGVALLELNGTAIAHSIFLEYNGHAYIYKTCFNNRYRKFGPGIYINHAVVRELMGRPGVKVIDFVTDLRFSHKWASEVAPVHRVIISRNHLGLLYLAGIFLLAGIRRPRQSFDLARKLYFQKKP